MPHALCPARVILSGSAAQSSPRAREHNSLSFPRSDVHVVV